MPSRSAAAVSLGSKRFLVRRWMRRVIGTMLALVLLGLSAALVLLNSLDRPWLKRRLQSFVLAKAGVELDYEAVHVRALSGLEIDALVARSPVSVRGVVPEMARVGRLRVLLSPKALVRGGPVISEVEIEHPALAVSVDENGTTSLDVVTGGARSEKGPSTPLSHWPAELLGSLSWLGRIRVTDLTATLVRTEQAVAVDRYTLKGFGIDLDTGASPAVDPPNARSATRVPRLVLSLGTPDLPLPLVLERSHRSLGSSVATAHASLVTEMIPSELRASLDVRVGRQDIVPGLSLDHLAQAKVTIRFDAALGRTAIEVAHLDLGDGAAAAHASLVIPDGASPVLTQVAIDADLARVLHLVPENVVPVRLGKGELHVRAEGVGLDPPGTSGTVAVEGSLAEVTLALAHGAVRLGDARISVSARPADDGFAANGTISVDAGHIDVAGTQARASGVVLAVQANGGRRGPYTGRAELRFATVEASRPISAAAGSGRIEVRAGELLLDEASPFRLRGDVTVEAGVASVVTKSALRASATGVRFDAHLPLPPLGPFAWNAKFESNGVRVLRPDGRLLFDAPTRASVGLEGFSPNLERPQASEGTVHAALALGALSASTRVTRRGDTIDYSMSGHAPRLGDVRPLVPEEVQRSVPWEAMAFDLHSAGRLTRVTTRDPELHQKSELSLTGAGFESFAARSIALELESRGTLRHHEARVDMRAKDLFVAKTAIGDDHLNVALSFDRARRSFDLDLGNEGLAEAKLALSASLGETDDGVSYRLAGCASHLLPLLPLSSKVPAISGFDLSRLGVRVTAVGSGSGVASYGASGGLAASSDWLRTLRGRGDTEVQVENLRWSVGDRALRIPKAAWRATFQTEDGRGTVQSDLLVDDLHLGMGRHRIEVAGLRDKTSLRAAGGVGDWSIDVSEQMSVRAVQQNAVPSYPIGNIASKVAGRLRAHGLVQVSALELTNGAAGTTFTGKGSVDWGEDRRRLSLRTSLSQDLSRVSTRQDLFIGKGNAGVDVSLDSTDLRVFHTKAVLRLEEARVGLPGIRVAIEDVDGEVPIVADLTFGREGPDLLRDVRVNPYTTLRFADQHPLLSSRSFLSIGSISTPVISIAPFAGNLRVEQNLLSFSQLEMGVRGGRITGDGVLEWNGGASKVHADLRATGVRSSHGEPFDGNAAFMVDAADHSIEGRADILRIGKRHLLDLLDFQDPQHLDGSLNRIRTALAFGYPKNVQISFKHGFARAGVSLGGLARFVSIDEVRGIPTGPLVERVVDTLKSKEQP